MLFLGGYQALPGIPLPAPVWMFAKIGALSFVVIWLRATYPRLREDQLQRFAWLVLIPFSLLRILVVAVVKVAVEWGEARCGGRREVVETEKDQPESGIGLGLLKGLAVTMTHHAQARCHPSSIRTSSPTSLHARGG